MYPLKFEDILRPMIWGGEEISRFKQLPEVHPGIGESWEISQVGERVSVVSEGEDKGKTITELIKRDGANLLGIIAQMHGTTVDNLTRLNGLSNPNVSYPGQIIKVR